MATVTPPRDTDSVVGLVPSREAKRDQKSNKHRRAPGLRRNRTAAADGVVTDPVLLGDESWREAFPSRLYNERRAKGPCWPVIGWLAAIHVFAIAGFWTFTWEGLALAVFLHWLTGSIGVCLGYHRYFTHLGFQTYRPIRFVLALIGGLSGEGSSLSWVAEHRQHHAHSDQEGDPHSPGDGSWWSHMNWLGWTLQGDDQKAHVRRWCPDLLKDPGLVWLDRYFILTHFVLGLTLAGAGYAYGGWPMAASFVVWGMFVRLVAILHTTWLVNSATHMWGYRNYETTDQSRNLWWVALLSYGEGWHNNHHAYPRMAKHGHQWWELDLTYRTLQLMQLCGLAWDVVTYRDHAEKAQAEAAK